MKQLLILLLTATRFTPAYSQTLTEEQAIRLARLPLHCINTEFPNKTSHTADDAKDAVLLPQKLHPSFYGCLDWHSSVHGHWLLVKVLKMFPAISIRDSIIPVLNNSFQSEKIKEEAAYFTKYKTTKTWERTYGWAWLLKLDEELYTWNDPLAKRWHETLQPLTRKIVELWKEFLPKQTYPNRTGVHPNTAFGLVFGLSWARTLKDTAFENAITKKAKAFYLNNTATPAYLEPDGSDFLSPSLEIADLVKMILPRQQFINWLNKFYEPRSIKRITEMPVVSDRTDFQIVHLDGLALSRAWCMKGIANVLPVSHPWKKLFERAAADFLKTALPNVTSGNYGGDHWLASFALYALSI
ncbi:MAG: DUF2891 domain-containing protein [Chitinophagaceae bacterium]|nr:DUF2891 domain-containing protein [Chitinophagaceae bacterium]